MPVMAEDGMLMPSQRAGVAEFRNGTRVDTPKEANRGRDTPSTEITCYHVAYLIGLSHLCALLVYQCLIVTTNENVQMKQVSAATFQNMELARNCYRSLHLKFVFNLILLKVIVILQYLVINLI